MVLMSVAAEAKWDEEAIIARIKEISRDGQIAQLDAEIQQSQWRGGQGVFDSQMHVATSHQIDASDQINAVFGTRNDTTNLSVAIETLLPSGTSLRGGWQHYRLSSNSPFINLDPAYGSSWTISARQPLWNNQWGQQVRWELESLKTQAQSAQNMVSRRRDLAVVTGLQLYWAWVAARQSRLLAAEGLQRAEDFVTITRRQARLGVAESADLFAAQANLLSRQHDLNSVEAVVSSFCTQLRYYLQWHEHVECDSNDVLTDFVELMPVSEYIKDALQGRRDITSMERQLAAIEFQTLAAHNRASPQFNLFTSLVFNAVDGELSQSIADPWTLSHPDWTVGAELLIPLGNRQAKELLIQTKHRAAITQLRIAQLKDDIRRDVEVAYDNLLRVQQRIVMAKDIRDLELKKLTAKERDFRLGRVEATQIILFQQDVLAASYRHLVTVQESVDVHLALRGVIGFE